MKPYITITAHHINDELESHVIETKKTEEKIEENGVEETVEVLTRKTDHSRDDYREFGELILVYLGGQQDIHFKRPGAIHKARFMAKAISGTKIVLHEDDVKELGRGPRGSWSGVICTDSQLAKLRVFEDFLSTIYSQWWATCPNAVDAPYNDLQLYKALLQSKKVNTSVADSAITTLKRHLWYLTGEWAVLSLFSDRVADQQK